MLLVGLAVLFPAFRETGPLYRLPHIFDHITFEHLEVAKNLSAEHGWLGLRRGRLNVDGEPVYQAYNRFPPLGYGLIKLATLTQPGTLAGQVQAARMLMLALYAGAAVLAYFSLVEIAGRRWLALAATLTAFGSYAVLRSCDMVATEGVVDLFGTLLAFHGIARYQPRPGPGLVPTPDAAPRLAQLVAKSCAALLLGWHVYGLLLPFVALGLAAALMGRDRAEFRRLLLFGAVAFLFGLAVLLQNFAREYVALGGATPIWELPSFRSMIAKSGAYGQIDGGWLAFALDQLQRAGLALLPYAATQVDVWWRGWAVLGALGFAVVGAAAAVAVVPMANANYRRVQAASRALVPLAVTGLAWAVGMRGNLYSYQWTWGREHRIEGWDVFESMFHVGVPLAVFSLLAMLFEGWIRPGGSRRRRLAAATVVVASCLAFLVSVLQMGQLGRHSDIARRAHVELADLDAARRVAAGGSIFGSTAGLAGPSYVVRHALQHFAFANHAFVRKPKRAALAEFVLAARIRDAHTLTPDNRFWFLYRMSEYVRHCPAPRLC